MWLTILTAMHNLQIVQNRNLQFFPVHLLPGVFPKRRFSIRPDGNCLFRCFSFFLSGDQDLYYSSLRKLICDNIENVPLNPHQFLAHSHPNNPSYTASEYLEKEQMRRDSVYGGDIEISTFCYLFNLQVVVYTDSNANDKWFTFNMFSGHHYRTVFLYHSNSSQHFEPIIETISSSVIPENEKKIINTTKPLTNLIANNLNSTISNYQTDNKQKKDQLKVTNENNRPISLSSANITKLASSNKNQEASENLETLKQSRTFNAREENVPSKKIFSNDIFMQGKKQQQSFAFATKVKNYQVDFSLSSSSLNYFQNCSSTSCMKCDRISTKWYPLQFSLISEILRSCFKKRKYGKKYVETGDLKICQSCLKYITVEVPEWKDAWPCVIYSVCLNGDNLLLQKLFYKLPLQIQSSWFFSRMKNQLRFNTNSVFEDITRDQKYFHMLITSYNSSDYKKCMNKYAFPSIRCFCGSSEFIEDVGFIDFHHVLNYLDPSFTSFEACWQENIKCIRSDYFDTQPNYLSFECKPSVAVNDNGLVICSCFTHRNGSKLNMCHVARHPIVGNLNHNYSDRLAPLTSSIRGATITKMGEFSNTFFMSKSVGGQNGIGSLTVHSNRNLSIKSDILLPAIETTFITNRQDTLETLKSIEKEYHYPEDLTNLFTDENYIVTDSRLNECMKAATYFPMSLINAVRDKNDNECEDSDVNDYLANHFFRDFSIQSKLPAIPPKIWFKDYYYFSLLIVMVNYINEIMIHSFKLPNELVKQVYQIANSLEKNRVSTKLLQKFLSANNLNYTDNIIKFFTEISKIFNWCVMQNRAKVPSDIHNSKIVILISSRPTKFQIPVVLKNGFNICFCEKRPSNLHENLFLFHHVPVEKTITINTTTITKKIKQKPGLEFEVLEEKLRIILFTKKEDLINNTSNLIDGRCPIKCPVHFVFLSVDHRDTVAKCKFENCSLKSKWRCPFFECSQSLCKRHCEAVFENESLAEKIQTDFATRVYTENELELDTEMQPIDTSLIETNNDEDLDEDHYYFSAPTCMSTNHPNTYDTDASVPLIEIDNPSSPDYQSLPIQFLFNVFLAILCRPKSPLSGNLKYKRFIQNFVTLYQKGSVSLLQLESLLFPSIFYKQMSDTSAPGALPFFLYATDERCKKLGFVSLLEHFRTRITDVSLLTSSNHRYIQFATDCLVNLKLRGKHTQEYFRRGIQSLNLYGRDIRLFSQQLNFSLTDTECNVRQLAAAFRTQMVTFFLTITCNQRKHPGVGPLLNALDSFYKNCSEEVRREAVNAHLVTLVRCWSRSVRHFVNLLKSSSEGILGKIIKIWGRAEFQTTAGNLPHYHILIWLEPGSYDPDDLIQCSEKHIFQKFSDLFQSTNNPFKTNEEMMSMYDNCVRIHTHSCEKSYYRCLKRKDIDGNKICRTPPQPPSHHHWKLNIKQQYPEEAIGYLYELGFAQKSAEGYCVNEPFICEKWMYAASKGEHLLPTCVQLFRICESSVTLLHCTGQFSCSYLTRYASKTEEHADAKISSGPDGKSFRLRNDGIQNKHLASVKFILEKEKSKKKNIEHISCHLLAITESIFWLLGEPYVFSNMSFINIQNTALEYRVVAMSNMKQNQCKKLTKLNFRNFVKDLPLFRRVTPNQQILQMDHCKTSEVIDSMSAFSLRPPELLVVSNITVYKRFFVIRKCNYSASQLIDKFERNDNVPWITCLGGQLFLRSPAVSEFHSFILATNCFLTDEDICRKNTILSIIESNSLPYYVDTSLNTTLLPEIVFKFLNPRNANNFLIGFLLRFGNFHTELDLFHSSNIIDSFRYAQLLDESLNYSVQDVNNLVKLYMLNDLRFQPGGVLPFSTKLIFARKVFSEMLQVPFLDTFSKPLVLISDMHSKAIATVEKFIQTSQHEMFLRVKGLGLSNLPGSPSELDTYWEPDFTRANGQIVESFEEQGIVLKKIISAMNNKFGAANLKVNHQVILGKLFNCLIRLFCFTETKITGHAQKLDSSQVVNQLNVIANESLTISKLSYNRR